MIVAIMASCLQVNGQAPTLLPPMGHAPFATDFDISFDDKTIATVGLDGKLIFWDVNSGRAYRQIQAHESECYNIRYSWKGDYLITSSTDGKVKIWTPQGDIVKTINVGIPVTFAEIERLQKKLCVAGIDGKVRIYSFPECELISVFLAHDGSLNFAVFSPNGEIVFTGDNKGVMRAFGSAKPHTKMLDLPLDAPVKYVGFDNNNSAMTIHTANGMAEVLLLPSFKSIGRIPVPNHEYREGGLSFVSHIDISPDSKWIAFANQTGIQLANGEDFVRASNLGKSEYMTTSLLLPHSDFIAKVRFSNYMKYIVTLGHDKRMALIQIEGVDLSKINDQFLSVRMMEQHGDYPRSIFFDDQFNIHMRGFYTYTWNMKNGDYATEQIHVGRDKFLRQSLKQILVDNLTIYYDANRDLLLLEKGKGLKDPTSMVWSVDRNTSAFEFDNKMYILNTKENSIIGSYKPGWKDKPKEMTVSNQGVVVTAGALSMSAWTAKGQKLWEQKTNTNPAGLAISLDGTKLARSNYATSLEVYDMQKGKLTTAIPVKEAQTTEICFLKNDDDKIAFAGFEREAGIISISQKRILNTVKTNDQTFKHIDVSPDGKLIGLITYDRKGLVYNIESQTPLFSLFTMHKNGLCIANSDNYYMSDRTAYQQLAFLHNNEVYTADQFDAIYNRPDLVLKQSPYAEPQMVAMLNAAWNKRMKMLGTTGSAGSVAPVTEIANLFALPKNTQQNQITLNVNVKDSVNLLSTLQVYVNDVPVLGLHGKDLSKGNRRNQDISLTIPVLFGDNVIKIAAVNDKGMASIAKTYEVTAHFDEKPRLYLVTIGASEYKESQYNLKYAAKDAKDVAAALTKSPFYKEVKQLTLLDGEVTKANLEKIKTLIKEATPQDVVIFYVAGHGVLDKDYNYYLASHDIQFNDPATRGISYGELETVMESTKALRKVLFMDTCHSGELDKDDVQETALVAVSDQNQSDMAFRSTASTSLYSSSAQTSQLAKELFADMRAGTGATVIGSSGGAEFAMESSTWNNGLFTYTLLNGIQSKEADLNGDGQIMLSELQEYLTDKVSELSGGKQRPTSRIENLSMDFRVW